MTFLFIALIIIASLVLGLIVLIQNPKGGGLSGTFGGIGNQFMGVKQTTDILEKGTWIFAGIIGVLCLTASLFIRGGSGGGNIPNITPAGQTQGTTPAGGAQQTNPPANQPNPADTNK
ncbi:MAG TPA: preprotein translocase subunit SecG [Chitinophagaceae bacterium]|jgi:preprotein translocase subunit SecG|nr:preprotein translocase subunit SecG [Chitinophagaceae bacterium]